jgi:hypothetical protein
MPLARQVISHHTVADDPDITIVYVAFVAPVTRPDPVCH